jgi:hypothetical protein
MMARATPAAIASCPMLLTDWLRWPANSHHRACRNALHEATQMARHRRESEEIERFVEETNLRRSRR